MEVLLVEVYPPEVHPEVGTAEGHLGGRTESRLMTHLEVLLGKTGEWDQKTWEKVGKEVDDWPNEAEHWLAEQDPALLNSHYWY